MKKWLWSIHNFLVKITGTLEQEKSINDPHSVLFPLKKKLGKGREKKW